MTRKHRAAVRGREKTIKERKKSRFVLSVLIRQQGLSRFPETASLNEMGRQREQVEQVELHPSRMCLRVKPTVPTFV